MGPELLIPLLFSAVSTGVGVISQVSAANQQKQQMEAQAAVQRQQAQNQRTEATLRSEDIQRRANRIAGAQAAQAAVGGADISGSIVEGLADTRAQAARDLFNVNWSADAKADNLEASASNLEWQGQQAVNNAWLGAGLKAASTFGGSLLTAFKSPTAGIDPQEKWFQALDRSPYLTQGGVV